MVLFGGHYSAYHRCTAHSSSPGHGKPHSDPGSLSGPRPRLGIRHLDQTGKGTCLALFQPKPEDIDPLAISVSPAHSFAYYSGFTEAFANPALERSPLCLQLLRMTTRGSASSQLVLTGSLLWALLFSIPFFSSVSFIKTFLSSSLF